MSKKTFGFIGCGNMGGALAAAACKSGVGRVLLANRTRAKAEALAARLEEQGAAVAVAENPGVAEEADYIFLGVKPQMMAAKALEYAAQTLAGAAGLVLESGQHPGALKDAVCSPGGSTIAGVHALENGAFRATAINAVAAAYEKTRALGKS